MLDVLIPSPGESVTEVRLGKWAKADGAWVDKDELLVEIESDKATLELLAPASGTLAIKAKAGTDLKVGALAAAIDTKAKRPASTAKADTATAAVATSAPTRVSGVARKMAADQGINVASVHGSGPGGRVMKADLAIKSVPIEPAAAPVKRVASVTGSRAVRRERMTKIRARIAERLVAAQHNAAMLTTFNEADMTEVIRLRSEHRDNFEKTHGIGLGFMGFFVKACVSGLQKFPRVNAAIDGDEMIFHDYEDISVAVGTDRGLVVPVIRDCGSQSLAQIETTIKDFAVRARGGSLTVDEMTGGTFTITNGGVFGSLMSTPILNAPQSGILGMHAIKRRAVEDPCNPGHVVIRPMMYLALSYDHRIVDGSEAVSFLVHVKDCIEKPERLLLGI